MQKLSLMHNRVRTWLIISAVFFALSVFLPKAVFGALTSPSTVVGGSQYGKVGTLGYYPDTPWRKENQKNRKIIYVNPATGLNLLVAAFVNDLSCSGILCRLEFRVSADNGLTWSQALAGATTWLDIAGSEYDYTLTLGSNGQDIWVSYADSVHDQYQSSTKIAKLTWSPSTSTWSITRIKSPVLNIQNDFTPECNSNLAYFGKSKVSVFVQDVSGTERVWVIATCRGDSNPNGYYNVLAYCDNFSANDANCTSSNNWQVGREVDSDKTIFDFWGWWLASKYQTRTAFVPIGNDKTPALIMVPVRYDYNPAASCISTNTGGIRISVGNSSPNSWRNWQTLKSVQPFVWEDNCTFPGSGARVFDYSVASLPVSDDTSRVVVAYEGGYESANPGTDYTNRVRVTSCLVSVSSGLTNCKSASIKTNTGVDIDAYAPSVGFVGTTAWLAMQSPSASPNDNLIISKEKAGSDGTWLSGVPLTYEWEGIGDTPAGTYPKSKSSQTPSLPELSGSAMLANSGLPPVIWSQVGDQKVTSSSNIGGSNIGGPENANSVFGWGWSSNFGWLSLNCANSSTLSNCNTVYGLGIGFENNLSPPATTVSPDGFRVGGYAWSPNAGWLSLERKESTTPTNTSGNPPGQAYNNSAGNDTVALSKYSSANQKIYGWGRFLNLCDLNMLGTCGNDDKGWVRLRGYWHDTSATSTISAAYSIGNTQLTFANAAEVDANFGSGGVVVIGDEYTTYTHNTGIGQLFITIDPSLQLAYPIGTAVYKVTGQEYGVDAYWNGSYYELNGWAWSNEYGWIQFKPLIFIGYAWLETLFGNVYSGTDIMLPKPENKSGAAIMCDYDNNPATGADGKEAECAVSTYRIEANGLITGLQMSGTSYSNPGATSNFSGTSQPTSGYTTDFFVRSRGDSQILYPSISESTVIYRNALGKLDLAGLIGFVQEADNLQYSDTGGPKNISTGSNRFGNNLYETKTAFAEKPSNGWATSLLGGLRSDSKWGTNDPPLERFNSQVIHITEDLTIDGASAKFGSKTGNWALSPGGTLTVSGISGSFPTPYPAAATFSPAICSTCALVIDPGKANEEYVSYSSITGATFSEVMTITGIKTHNADSVVRSVWRLPYTSGETKAQTATIIVDGNLKINYNIIGSQPSNPLKIRDVPTIAFIVKGDVTIDPAVNKLTGAYIVMGTNDTVGGSFNTGNDRSSCPVGTGTEVRCNPLVLDGLVMARQFNLERYGSKDLSLPGEQIRYDTGLFLNPPPGLEDVSKALSNPIRTQP